MRRKDEGEVMDEKLKPCPFCGGKAHVYEDQRFTDATYNFPKWRVACSCCHAQTETATMEFVVKRWNERISDKEERWIPASERLPEEEQKVLVTRKFLGVKDRAGGWNNHIAPSIYVEIAERIDDRWMADSDEYKIARSRHTDPIAWMPLPKPWKGGEQNG